MQQKNYSVSCRNKRVDQPVDDFLNLQYPAVDKFAISTVFGFVERTTLYGGRIFIGPELSESDVQTLYNWEVGLKLPLTNTFASEEEYEKEYTFLEKYHRKGNSVVLVNDELARWIRRDFPDYEIEASVIKNISKQSTIDKYLDIYDIIVLPMDLHRQPEYLESLEPKSRLRLFITAACAFTCPAKTCYKSISRINKMPVGEGHELFNCSQNVLPREMEGFQEFDVDQLVSMGFTKFKVTRNPKKFT